MESGMRWWVLLAPLVLAGCATSAAIADSSEVDAYSFCTGRMGHAPGSAKYQSCVAAQVGANSEGVARRKQERDELQALRAAAAAAYLPPLFVPLAPIQPPRQVQTSCTRFGNRVDCTSY